MHICIYVYMYICMYVCMYVCIYRVNPGTLTSSSARACSASRWRQGVRVYLGFTRLWAACSHWRTYMCIYIYIHIYIYIYTYIYI